MSSIVCIIAGAYLRGREIRSKTEEKAKKAVLDEELEKKGRDIQTFALQNKTERSVDVKSESSSDGKSAKRRKIRSDSLAMIESNVTMKQYDLFCS